MEWQEIDDAVCCGARKGTQSPCIDVITVVLVFSRPKVRAVRHTIVLTVYRLLIFITVTVFVVLTSQDAAICK